MWKTTKKPNHFNSQVVFADNSFFFVDFFYYYYYFSNAPSNCSQFTNKSLIRHLIFVSFVVCLCLMLFGIHVVWTQFQSNGLTFFFCLFCSAQQICVWCCWQQQHSCHSIVHSSHIQHCTRSFSRKQQTREEKKRAKKRILPNNIRPSCMLCATLLWRAAFVGTRDFFFASSQFRKKFTRSEWM